MSDRVIEDEIVKVSLTRPISETIGPFVQSFVKRGGRLECQKCGQPVILGKAGELPHACKPNRAR